MKWRAHKRARKVRRPYVGFADSMAYADLARQKAKRRRNRKVLRMFVLAVITSLVLWALLTAPAYQAFKK